MESENNRRATDRIKDLAAFGLPKLILVIIIAWLAVLLSAYWSNA